jgi:PAS domain S-box-containing protein/putative nucleotidyltransferase with HDIG domain
MALMEAHRLPRLGVRSTLVLVLVLYAAVFALRAGDPRVADAEAILYVIPVGVLALSFGLRGGVIGALLGCALVLAWMLTSGHPTLSLLGYIDRALGLLLLGLLIGAAVDRRRTLEEEIALYYESSLDLLATADFSGRFTRVNPAWERTLGYSPAEMISRPFTDFVHPGDVAATNVEMGALRSGERVCRGFRNRYRAADGHYRWLEWSACASPSANAIHAVARDITEQRMAERRIARSAARLREMVAERTYELDRARTETLQLLALAGEYRDDDTSDHTERVAAMAAELAQRLGLDAQTVEHLREAALLHDVGKIAIPDHILLNAGTLSAEEQEIMRTHAVLGARLLRGSGSPVLQMASVIAACHHEWWDGSGYPAGLAGKRIPLVGRIVAVADVFDALTHDRPYKPAWPVERAVARIERGAGSQFDPRVVAAFLAMPHEVGAAAVPGVLSRHLAPNESVHRRWDGRGSELLLPRLAHPA